MPPVSSTTDKRKLFVGSLTLEADENMVREAFEKFGEIIELKLVSDDITKVSKGYCFVTFKNIEDALEAKMKMDGEELDGKNLKVDFAGERQISNWAAQWHNAQGRSFQDRPPVVNPSLYKELPFDKANKIVFDEFGHILDAIQKAKGAKKKLDLLFSTTLTSYLKDQSWYPILRLVLPDLDRERPRYGLKQAAMANLYVKAFGLQKGNQHEARLKRWKDPAALAEGEVGGAVGDFPNVLREVLDSRGFQETSRKLTIGDINTSLDELHNANSQDEKEKILMYLLNNCNSREMFWITRIVLKDMNCGLRYESVLKRYHKDAIDAMDSHGDLRRCIAELSDPNVSRAYTVELFSTIAPMLAKIVKMDVATEKLGDFVIEPKLDGDRMLVHIDKTQDPPKVMLFTRNAFDCKKCVLDGEMLSWDDEEGITLDFGQNTTVANEMNQPNYVEKRFWLYYMCFDILFLDMDGHHPSVLTGEPLRQRRSRLQSILNPMERKIELVPQVIVTTQDLEERHQIVMSELDKIITQKGEGLILKSLGSAYTPGETSRRSGNWVKVKPEHVNGLQEEIDVLILGGYYSEGRRRSSNDSLAPSVFLVGVPGGKKNENGKPAEFFCLAKIGTGYSFKELDEIRRRIAPYTHRTTGSDARPKHFVFPVRKQDFPDVWVEPEHSLVLQVTGSELVPCDWFSANYTLRFPRCSRIREDKSWLDCTPFSEVERFAIDFKAGNGLHGAKRAIDVGRLESASNKRGGVSKRRRQAETILKISDVSHLSSVQVEENAPLQGWNFFIFPLKEDLNVKGYKTVEEVQAFIKSKGGRVMAAYSNKMEQCMYLATAKHLERPSQQLLNMLKNATKDLLKIEFVIDCVENSRYLNEPNFSDYLWMSKTTRSKMKKFLDKYGDHYTEKSDALSLKRCMEEVKLPKENDKKQKREELLKLLDDEEDPLGCSYNRMRGIFAYFPNLESSRKEKIASTVMRLHGGVVVNSLEDPNLTHVFIHPSSESPEELTELVQNLKQEVDNIHPTKNIIFAHAQFIFACANSDMTWEFEPIRDFLLK